jgi:hypothetical protein
MHADAWFESEDAAAAAGFKRWDWRRRAANETVSTPIETGISSDDRSPG